MNTNLLDKPIVLSLNRAWQIIGHRTVKQALIALNGGSGDLAPALGIDIASALIALMSMPDGRDALTGVDEFTVMPLPS